jgi:hypothetical protein
MRSTGDTRSLFKADAAFEATLGTLLELAIGNAGMATAGLIWLFVDHRFTVTGATLLSVAIAWKLAIGFLQARSLRPAPFND